VHRLDGGHAQVTALNFSSDPIADRVTSDQLRPGATVRDMLSERKLGAVDEDGSFPIGLGPHQGLSLLVADPTGADLSATPPPGQI
jgi:hypothetical protein